MDDTRRLDANEDALERTIRDHCGELLGGGSYLALLDEPGGLEFIGAMIQRGR